MISQNTRSFRANKGESLHSLAAKPDISVAYLQRIERGMSSPTIDVVGRLGAALETTPNLNRLNYSVYPTRHASLIVSTPTAIARYVIVYGYCLAKSSVQM